MPDSLQYRMLFGAGLQIEPGTEVAINIAISFG
jgi:hypothetical protein